MISNQDELRALFSRLEVELPIENMRVFDFNYWPILRFAINYKRKYGKNLTSIKDITNSDLIKHCKKSKISCFSSAVKRVFELRKIQTSKYKNSINKIKTADIIYFVRGKEHTYSKNGFLSAPILDQIAKSHGECWSSVKIIPEEKPSLSQQYLVEPIFVPISPFIASEMPSLIFRPTNLRQLAQARAVLKTIEQTNSILRRISPNLVIGTGDMLYRISVTIASIRYCEAILRQVRPKVVFMTSYTGRSFMVAAARRNNIAVVDVQHGGAHRNNIAMANWHNVPDNGYELLPDWFWCWSQRSADYVRFPAQTPHKSIVGGNPSYAFHEAVRNAEYPMLAAQPDDDVERLLDNLRTGARPTVLVALQYGKDDLIDAHVRDAYLATRDEIDWIFRLHPMGRDRLPELLKIVDQDERHILAASRIALPLLLKHGSLVLTKSSTIVQEAADAGLPAIVWSEKGASNFVDLVEQNLLTVALDAESLIAALRGHAQSPATGTGVSPQESARLARAAMDTILQKAGARQQA